MSGSSVPDPWPLRVVGLLSWILPRRHREVFEGDLVEQWHEWRSENPRGANRRMLVAGFRGLVSGAVHSLRTTHERRLLERLALGGGDGEMMSSGDGLGGMRGIYRLWADSVQDVRIAGRRLIRAPAFTAVAVLSIALGVGGNTALFTLIEELILRPPPFADPEELVDIRLLEPGDAFGTFSYLSFRELEQATSDVYESVAGVMFNMVSLNDGSGRSQSLMNELVAGPYFQVLGVGAQIGRVFSVTEGVDEGVDPVVVISDAYWRSAFGADPGVVGTSVLLNGHPFTIVGVADASFKGVFPGLVPDVWAHASMSDQISLNGPGSLTNRGQESLIVKGRLAEDVTFAEAETVTAAFGEDLVAGYPDNYAGNEMAVTPTLASPLHPALDSVVLPVAAVVMTVVGLVLLIACVNLAGFLLARAEGRRREIAVRLALGARRGRLVRSLLTETSLIALAGGALGILLSVYLLDFLLSIDLPLPIDITLDASLNLRVFAFALAISVVAGLILGLAPALQSTRPDVSSTLKDESTGGSGRAQRMRDVLVVGQVAGSAVLLIMAGLFIRSLVASQSIDPGFGRDPAAIALLELPTRTDDERRAFFEELMTQTAALPGVRDVGMITMLPLEGTGTSTISLTVEGVDPPPGRTTHEVDWVAVGGDFFQAVGIELVAGRPFGPQDDLDTDPVAMVSQAMAARFWPGEDPMGRVFTSEGQESRVVGVVADTKVRTLSEARTPLVYHALSQQAQVYGRVVARTATDPAPVASRMLDIASEIDPGVILIRSRTMDQHLAFMLVPARISAIMLGLMGFLALLLAAIGLYGIVAYSVAARDREMGIRMSVGAEPGRLVGMVLRAGMKRVVLGLGIGLGLAVPAALILRSSLYGVQTLDPATFIGAALILSSVAALAAYLPARRASRVDPVVALKGG